MLKGCYESLVYNLMSHFDVSMLYVLRVCMTFDLKTRMNYDQTSPLHDSGQEADLERVTVPQKIVTGKMSGPDRIIHNAQNTTIAATATPIPTLPGSVASSSSSKIRHILRVLVYCECE